MERSEVLPSPWATPGRSWRAWVVPLAVTVGLYAYIFSVIDLERIVETARRMPLAYVGGFVTLLLGGVVARAVRFWLLLGREPRLSLLTGVVMVRNLFVDLLPARIGELSYVYLLTARARRTVEEGLATLFLSMVFDLIALAPLLLLMVVFVGGDGTNTTTIALSAAAVLGTVGLLAMRLAVPVGRRVGDWLDPAHPHRWRAQLAGLVARGAEALRTVEARGIFGPVLAVSMVVRLTKFGSFYCLVLAVMTPLGYTAEGLGFFPVFAGVLSGELAAALPIPGLAGLGTVEVARGWAFTLLGFSAEDAFTTSTLVHWTTQLVEYTMGLTALLVVLRPWRAKSAPVGAAPDRTPDAVTVDHGAPSVD